MIDPCSFSRKLWPLDGEALKRGSSIYTADKKIPMLPAEIFEGLCSLMR
ncbi:MAG: RNB domain-containing ribonuclease [Thermodesulfobacteriota bacterium]|nr:RNB domain-containing ribonuclease [Thermodesulfobacteriota bacterium]